MFKFITLFVVGLSLSVSARDWWENGNFYQVYPRSFKDSNGDGVGDLNGVAQKIEYLRDLGMDGVWLSPIMKSPMADFGYDISDYYQVQAEYGSLDDLLRLIEKAHSVGLKLILDFVPNHTSDEHEWFQKSVANDSYYRDFYIWHDGKINAETGEREPPSNWLSQFKYSAWEWNDQRQQYYLHQFGVKQPDLNYRNPNVVAAMKDVLNFWMDHGIDGFRIDAVPFLFESEIDPETGTYPDEPVEADTSACPDPTDWCHLQHPHTNSLPECIDMVYQWRQVIDIWKLEHNSTTKILLTEAYTSFENLMKMYGDGQRNGSHVPFNFEMLANLNKDSTAEDYRYYVKHWVDNMPDDVYANWVLGNHDNRRVASRFGPQRKDLLNIFLQTLPGISVTYNGDEYGAEDVEFSWEDSVDPQACNADPETYQRYTRDPVRAPFRWDSSANAGFSSAAKTWLLVGDGYENNNVEAQLAADNSHLKIFLRVNKLRREEPAFSGHSVDPVVVDNVLVYERNPPYGTTGDSFLVVLNIGDVDVPLDLSQYAQKVGQQVEVSVSSLQSGHEPGQVVDSGDFAAKANVGYVLRLI
ncbi:maltase A1-like [Musca autumnalis]|uniref:maltase A1-like n=1 Tax=Musca autumnalis TaxID=221902 RepID=UPI003CF7C03C